MSIKDSFPSYWNAQTADTSISQYHFEDERLLVEVSRVDGLKASFSIPTNSLDDLLDHLTAVLNVAGYGYVSGLEAIRHGEEDEDGFDGHGGEEDV